MDVREELAQLYCTYNPRRLKDIDEVLARFKGRERAMVAALREKYARNGASTNSSFLGSAPMPRATESSRQTAACEAAASASVGEAHSSASVLPPPLFRNAGASLSEDATGDPASAVAFGTPMTPSCSSSAAIQRATAFTALAPAAAVPAERHLQRREMAQLIDQMCSVDVGRLADRVAMVAAAAPSQPSRTPRLQWRQSGEMSALEAYVDGNGSRYSCTDNKELAELLRHTAVFLNFFSRCARRFLLLAEEEEERLAGAALATSRGASLSSAPPRSRELQTDVKAPQRCLHQRFHGTCGSKDNAEQIRSDSSRPSHDNGHHEYGYRGDRSGNGDGDKRAGCGNDNRASSSRKSRAEHQVAIESGLKHSAAPSTRPSPATAPAHSRDVGRADTAAFGHRRSSCVRCIRQPPLPSTACPRSSTALMPLPTTGRDEDRMTSVGGRRGGSSSPTYRTTTVSPLTSPNSGLSEGSPRTPSPPRLIGEGGQPRAATAAATVRAHVGQRSPSAPLDSSPFATPPRPPTSPPRHGGALVLRSPPSQLRLARRQVYTWTPSSQPNRYAEACAALESGDCVVLQPGVYYEELLLDNCGHVEVTSAYPGAAVVLRPSSDLVPALRIRGARSQVELKGIVIVQGEGVETVRARGATAGMGTTASAAPALSFSAAPAMPLLSVSDGASLQATACHFYGGAGGGVVINGAHTRATLDLCLVSLCGFAGIYVHNYASVEVRQSRVKKCEAGLRVLQSSFHVHESTLEDNKTDGVVVYEGSRGVLEGSSVMNNGGNGLFLEGGAGEEVQVIASTIELNALYGVQRLRGSILHIRSSYIRDNGLLPINDEGD
ncbi:hypothetical protein CUR178_08461 [Leishmania enriettii]|uniref:Right handed beta helix domain-containing protein n=1 Tax=Leishmania enriettii TaxID=5663 RepID=A0A836I2X2_LEIEN|nr:hypothetical protein CUR178_08461 [Leishmania enriettii]